MRVDGIFIAIDVDDAAGADVELARRLTDACPVDIFAQNDDGTLRIEPDNVDECVLCRLCLDTTPDGTVKVIKLYDEESVLA